MEPQTQSLIDLIFGNKLETRMLRENDIVRKQNSTDLVDLYYFGSCFVPLSGCTKSTNSTNQFTSRTYLIACVNCNLSRLKRCMTSRIVYRNMAKTSILIRVEAGITRFQGLSTAPTTEVIREVGTVPLEKLVVRPQPKESITRHM